MRVCPVTAVSASDLGGQADVLVLVFTYVQNCESAFRGSFWMGFGMFCLFRAALLSAYPAVYWLGMA